MVKALYLCMPAKLTISILSIDVKSDEYVPYYVKNKDTFKNFFRKMDHLKSLDIDSVRNSFKQRVHDMKVHYQYISIYRVLFL